MPCQCSAVQAAPCNTAAENESEGPKGRPLPLKRAVAHLRLVIPSSLHKLQCLGLSPGNPKLGWALPHTHWAATRLTMLGALQDLQQMGRIPAGSGGCPQVIGMWA